MGARTNFVIRTTEDPNQDIVLYSHWGGDSAVMDLAFALNKAMPRIKMGDTSYAVRIIVSQLINSDWDSETGFGLYVGEVNHEEQYEYKLIDLNTMNVTIGDITKPIDKFVSYHLDSVEV